MEEHRIRLNDQPHGCTIRTRPDQEQAVRPRRFLLVRFANTMSVGSRRLRTVDPGQAYNYGNNFYHYVNPSNGRKSAPLVGSDMNERGRPYRVDDWTAGLPRRAQPTRRASDGPVRERRLGSGGSPIMTRKRCATPDGIRLEMQKRVTQQDRAEVLYRVLEKQKSETTILAGIFQQLQLTEQYKELKKIADQAVYSMAAFNWRMQQRKRIPYLFEKVNMPQANVNPDLAIEVLELRELRAMDYVIPADCGPQMETCVQLELAYPSMKKPQKFKTDWKRYSNGMDYLSDPVRFTVNPSSPSYVRVLQLKQQLKAVVYYNRRASKKPNILGWAYFTIGDLLHSANVQSFANLNSENGVIPGYLKLQLRQRYPIEGPHFIIRRKPWLILMVDDMPNVFNASADNVALPMPRSGVTCASPTRAVTMSPALSPLSAGIVHDLRRALDSPEVAQVKLSVLRGKMAQLHEAVQTDFMERQHYANYKEELQRLLVRFKSNRKEAERDRDVDMMKLYLKREMLLASELQLPESVSRAESQRSHRQERSSCERPESRAPQEYRRPSSGKAAFRESVSSAPPPPRQSRKSDGVTGDGLNSLKTRDSRVRSDADRPKEEPDRRRVLPKYPAPDSDSGMSNVSPNARDLRNTTQDVIESKDSLTIYSNDE